MQRSVSFAVPSPACQQVQLCPGILSLQWRKAICSLCPRQHLEGHSLSRVQPQAAAVLEAVTADAAHTQEDWVYKLRREARAFQKKGNYEHAKRLLRDGLTAEPASCSLLTTLANVLGREGKADEARLVYSQAAAADPSSSVPIQVPIHTHWVGAVGFKAAIERQHAYVTAMEMCH